MNKNAIFILISIFLLMSGCINEENKKPLCSFTYKPLNITINSTIFFNSTSSDPDGRIVNYSWHINDIFYSYNENISYRFQQNGTYDILLQIIDNKGAMGSYQKTIYLGDTTFYKEKIIGNWQWITNDQVANWTFYENNTLKTVFTGITLNGKYGASINVSWHYEITQSELIFTAPNDFRFDEATYQYEFLENDTLLRLTYEASIADFYRIEK